MNRNHLLITLVLTALVAVVLVLEGCQNTLTRTFVDASSIPDQTYDVTIYKGRKYRSYAVLFDIPDDGIEVIMSSTRFTRRIGLDSPPEYIEEFRDEIKHYSTIRISDQNGEVRGYLLVSILLKYWIRPVEDTIMVSVELDPAYYNTPK